MLHPDETVGFGVLDLDPTTAAMEQMRLGDDTAAGGLTLPALARYAARLRAVAEDLGLQPMLEDTGGSGLHLWLFFAPRISAERARGVLRELLWRGGPQPPAVAVEIFPKQAHLTGKGLGNLVKLPLGVHQATLRRSCFLDQELRPLSDEAALGSVGASDPAAIDALIAKRIVPLPGVTQPDAAASQLPRAEPPQPACGPSPRALAEALAATAPGRDTIEAVDRVLDGCLVLRELARRAQEERALAPDAARALLYTVGLVGRENPRIEDLFVQAGVARKELDRVRRGLQSPVGCRKLRERFPDLCARCACPEPETGGYATPVLFALRRRPGVGRRRVEAPLPAGVADDQGDLNVVELQQRLARIESALQRLLSGRDEDAGVREP